MIEQAFFLITLAKEQLEDYIIRYPALDEKVRNWQPIAQEGDKVVVHVRADIANPDQLDRLKNHVSYLGRSYKEVAQKAKAGDAICKAAIRRIVFTNWEIDNPDYPEEGPEGVNHKGNLGEWLTAGRPEKLSGWFPAHVWLGHGVETPDETDVED